MSWPSLLVSVMDRRWRAPQPSQASMTSYPIVPRAATPSPPRLVARVRLYSARWAADAVLRPAASAGSAMTAHRARTAADRADGRMKGNSSAGMREHKDAGTDPPARIRRSDGSLPRGGPRLGRQVEPQMQLLQSLRRHFGRCAHHQVLALLVEREQDHLAYVRLVRQQHHDAVDAGRGPTMGRRTIAERVQHPAEAFLPLLGRMAGDLEGADHDIRTVIADSSGTQLGAVAHDVVLERLDGQRVLRVQRLQPALRHAERIVAEIDFSGFLVELEHWEIGDPAKAKRAGLPQALFLRKPGAHRVGEPGRRLNLAGDEEHCVARPKSAGRTNRFGAVRFEIACDRPLRPVRLVNDVAEAAGA